MEKDFTSWHKVKSSLQSKKTPPTFQEREIWWCSVGANVGDEEDGKGANFRRPVLVIRKFNKRIFRLQPKLKISLTTTKFVFKEIHNV